MTLATVPRYDPDRIAPADGETVVVGSGMAGLLADFAFPETDGPKPAGTDLVNRYFSWLLRRAHTDGTLQDAFGRVLMMERPPSLLFHPRIVWRVLIGSVTSHCIVDRNTVARSNDRSL